MLWVGCVGLPCLASPPLLRQQEAICVASFPVLTLGRATTPHWGTASQGSRAGWPPLRSTLTSQAVM
jgi:hypothetical protein